MTPTVEQINWRSLGHSNTHELEKEPISTGSLEDTDRDIGYCQA